MNKTAVGKIIEKHKYRQKQNQLSKNKKNTKETRKLNSKKQR